MKKSLLSLLAVPAACVASAQYGIDGSKVSGGGGTSTGGAMTNGPVSVTGGFGALPMLAIAINPHLSTITLSRTPLPPGFTLQSTASLSPTNWVNAPSTANNPATVPAPPPARFYRLFKP